MLPRRLQANKVTHLRILYTVPYIRYTSTNSATPTCYLDLYIHVFIFPIYQYKGSSGASATYGNSCLSGEAVFDVMSVEVWGLSSLGLRFGKPS
jgi:hypothetical protein